MGSTWVLASYRTPSAPSTARVTAWRGLHRLGGLFLGPTVCVLPAALADSRQLEAIASRVRRAGGSFDVFRVESFVEEAETLLRDRYNAARDAEYAEIVERAGGLIDELEREGAREKFTFAEVEENEADLAKLQRWLRRVRGRDLFGAGSRQAAVREVENAAARLGKFVAEAIAREGGDVIDASDSKTGEAPRALRVVRDR